MPANEPSGRSSRDDHRERLRQQRQAEIRRQKNVRTAVISVVVILVLVIAGGLGWLLWSSLSKKNDTPEKTDKAVVAPAGLGKDQAYYEFGPKSGKPVVDLYVDFQCPGCGQFHQIQGKDLDTMIQKNEATVRLHTRTFLDSMSSTDYSTRAANAAACVYDDNPKNMWKMQDELFDNQPEEHTAGLTNKELTALATKAGASDSVAKCISDGTYTPWLKNVVEPEAQKNAPDGTPMVFINGKLFEDAFTPGALTQAVSQAGAGKGTTDAK